MAYYQLILSTDTLDVGRQKINNFFINNSNLLSAGTGIYSILTVGGNNTNKGNYSFVSGKDQYIVSNSFGSILSGKQNRTQGDFASVIGGYKNSATTAYSVILGGSNNRLFNDPKSFILGGFNNISSGYRNVILGGSDNSLALYSSNSIVGGFNNSVNAAGINFTKYNVILWGKNNVIRANADYSIIMGGHNNFIDRSKRSVIVGGRYNEISQAPYSMILGGTGNGILNNHNGAVVLGTGGRSRGSNTFVFANGATTTTSAYANNIFRILNTGAAILKGTLTQNGTADYAEYFEWEDGNTNNQDRTGLFVSIINDKIIVDNSNVIGIVSSTPSIIGDGAEEYWSKLHKRDIWGREIYETYSGFTLLNQKDKIETKTYYLNSENKIFIEPPSGGHTKGILAENININDLDLNSNVGILKINVFNEDYDPNREYIPRSERKEWSPIGLLGKILVKTSEVISSTKVDAGPDGKAKNGTKYDVLKKIKEFDGDYGIVQIFFK